MSGKRLTDAERIWIKHLYFDRGLQYRQIAAKVKCSPSTAHRVINKKISIHLKGEKNEMYKKKV
jgi:IS30 family transposase